jgi:hypothetical protein
MYRVEDHLRAQVSHLERQVIFYKQLAHQSQQVISDVNELLAALNSAPSKQVNNITRRAACLQTTNCAEPVLQCNASSSAERLLDASDRVARAWMTARMQAVDSELEEVMELLRGTSEEEHQGHGDAEIKVGQLRSRLLNLADVTPFCSAKVRALFETVISAEVRAVECPQISAGSSEAEQHSERNTFVTPRPAFVRPRIPVSTSTVSDEVTCGTQEPQVRNTPSMPAPRATTPSRFYRASNDSDQVRSALLSEVPQETSCRSSSSSARVAAMRRTLTQLEMQLGTVSGRDSGSESKYYALSRKIQKVRSELVVAQREEVELAAVQHALLEQRRGRENSRARFGR